MLEIVFTKLKPMSHRALNLTLILVQIIQNKVFTAPFNNLGNSVGNLCYVEKWRWTLFLPLNKTRTSSPRTASPNSNLDGF